MTSEPKRNEMKTRDGLFCFGSFLFVMIYVVLCVRLRDEIAKSSKYMAIADSLSWRVNNCPHYDDAMDLGLDSSEGEVVYRRLAVAIDTVVDARGCDLVQYRFQRMRIGIVEHDSAWQVNTRREIDYMKAVIRAGGNLSGGQK